MFIFRLEFCIQQDGENEDTRPSTDADPLLSSLPTAPWLERLERLCAALGASTIRHLVMGAPRALQEEANARWLLHPLLVHAEVGSWREEDAGCQEKVLPALDDAAGETPPSWAGASASSYAFVQHLCRRPASRESCALSAAMKRAVLEDRGGDADTNDAVWVVTVAIVHHAGVAGEAADVVRAELALAPDEAKHEAGSAGAPSSLSPALVRAWRSAQTARARLGSAALSSDARALLLRRAYFLLFLRPWVSTSRRRGGSPLPAEGIHDEGVALALRTGELVLECLLGPAAAATRDRSDRGDHSSSDGGGGGGGGGVVSNHGGSREEGVGALLRIIEVQSERATSRARGLLLAVRLLDGTGSDRAAAGVLRAVTGGLRAGWPPGLRASGSEGAGGNKAVRGEENGEGGHDHDAPRFHFTLGVECCDSASRAALVESTAGFLRQCSLVLGQGRAGGRGGGTPGSGLARRSVLVHALVAVSMDYEWDDGGILQRSQLLPMISRLADDADRWVAVAASTAVRAVFRCAVPELNATNNGWASREQPACGGGDCATRGYGAAAGETQRTKGPKEGLESKLASSSTPFQKAFFAAVRCKLEDLAAATGTGKQVKLDRNLPTSSTTLLAVDESLPAAGVGGKVGGSTGSPLAGGEAAAGEKEAATADAVLAAAQVLALAHACCRVECGRRELSGMAAVRALLRLVLLAESETRGWALRVCAATLPWVEPGLVDGEFR